MTTTGSEVRYRVRLDPLHHEIQVTLVIEGHTAGEALRVESPTWVPGDYHFMTFGRDVFAVQATDEETDEALTVHREGWQGYRIDRIDNAGRAIKVTYRASCSSTEFSETCGILGDRNGVLLGTRYLRVASYSGPCTLTYELPDGWVLHHPSGAYQRDDTTWQYPSYEVLLDTPVVVGLRGAFDHLTRTLKETEFHYIFLDRGMGFESQVDKFVDQVTTIAGIYYDMFGSFPFEDYTYVYSLDSTAEWGLEHLTSTMIGLGPDVFTDPRHWATGIRVCAHELFHAWNVRRLRPAPLGALDLRCGSFTEGLWVAEGFTRYYEFLSCTRAGVYSPQQFFSAIVNYYRHLVALPAYQRVSAVDASLATFLNHNDKYPGRVNNAVDYYDQGMLIAFSLDVALRNKTSSLDDTFSRFFREYVDKEPGYTLTDLEDFLDSVQVGLGEQVIQEAVEPGCLTAVSRLKTIGFTVEEETVPYLGLVMQDDKGPGIYGVLDTSTAAESGIAPGDVITAVDGQPYELDALTWARDHMPSVTLDVLRGNQNRTYTITTGQRTCIHSLTWVGDDKQAKSIKDWLKQDFTPAQGENIPLDFYENPHGIETVI